MDTPASNITAIIFDCFGVLTSSAWMEFLATLPPEQVETARALNYRQDAGQLEPDAFIAELAELTGRSESDLCNTILHPRGDRNQPLFDYIATLKPNFAIGLLSNVGSNWITSHFFSAEEAALFDDMVLSYQVKLAKPDPAIFRLSAERLGVELPQCVLIDDGQANCAAAQRLGMQAIEYHNFTDFRAKLEGLLKQS